MKLLDGSNLENARGSLEFLGGAGSESRQTERQKQKGGFHTVHFTSKWDELGDPSPQRRAFPVPVSPLFSPGLNAWQREAEGLLASTGAWVYCFLTDAHHRSRRVARAV